LGKSRKTNLYLGQYQYWSHELVWAFNHVLHMLAGVIAFNIFGWSVFFMKMEQIIFFWERVFRLLSRTRRFLFSFWSVEKHIAPWLWHMLAMSAPGRLEGAIYTRTTRTRHLKVLIQFATKWSLTLQG
jgi:hypothetical protein